MKKILLFVFFLFSLCNVVRANNATLIKEKFDDTYVYYYDNNLGRNRYLYASKYIFGNDVAYCIELGKAIDSFSYTYSSSFDGINLSSEQIDIITHIEDTIAGKTKQQYYKPQSVWNEELAHALNEGELIEALDLMQVGKKLGFVKSIKCISENAEYLGKLNSFISKIKRTMDRNEAR